MQSISFCYDANMLSFLHSLSPSERVSEKIQPKNEKKKKKEELVRSFLAIKLCTRILCFNLGSSSPVVLYISV